MFSEITMFGNDVKQNEKVFDMIDPFDNDTLENMSERELIEFITLLEEYRIDWREKLENIPKNATFGSEIECVKANIQAIREGLQNSSKCSRWGWSKDVSLPQGNTYVTIGNKQYCLTSEEYQTDVLNNNKWDNLYEGCSIIFNNSSIDEHCGGHVNIGAQVLGRKKQNWLDFFRVWAGYEDIIYRFASGKDFYARFGLDEMARPLSTKWSKLLKNSSTSLSLNRIISKFGSSKFDAVNLLKVIPSRAGEKIYGNVVEVRVYKGNDPIEIQNNINLSVNIMKYAGCNDFNFILVDNRREELYEEISDKTPIEKINYYNEFRPYKALEFADMLFDSNIDKINFFKQYVKSIESLYAVEHESVSTLVKRKK